MGRVHNVPEWVYEGFLSVQAAEGPGLRRGLCTVETPENIRKRLDPAMAERLHEQGIGFVILSGIIGGGLRNERETIEANKPLAKALKAKGIRRVFYTQTIGNFFQEALCAETPEAMNWVQRPPEGGVPIYYNHWYRQIPCINNDDFIAYMKNLLRTVMTELDLDGVFTDNYGYYSYSCSCEHCRRKFRAYLDRKYPNAESRKARFEFGTPFDYVTPPPFKTIGRWSPHTQIPERNQVLDPVTQEWIRFRCERLGEVTREFNQVMKECNPEAIWFVNYLYGGTPGLNCAVFHGSWPACVYPNADLISAEVSGPPALNENGVASGRTLLMKVAKHFNVPLSTCTFDRPLNEFKRLFLAEGMAFNMAPMDLSGDIWRDDPPNWMRHYLEFYRTNRGLVGHAPTVADCAVLHSFETLSYACTYPQESLVLCEQSLLQAGVTFDIVFNEDLDRLKEYPCLFLSNVLSLSAEAVEKIAEYVRQGGAVVATEDTSILNERMLPWKGEWLFDMRKTHLLADVLGFEWPVSGVLHKRVGKGRVAVIAEVQRPWGDNVARGHADQERAQSPLVNAAHSYGPPLPMILQTPALALNHRDIVAAVEYALNGDRTVRVENDGPVIPEVTRNCNGTFVHLLNWNEEKPVMGIKVSLLHPPGKVARSVELISPDRETAATPLPFALKANRVEFTVPSLLCYNVIVVR